MQLNLTPLQAKTINNTDHIASSDKYVQIQTKEIIDRFTSNGFIMNSVQVSNFRKAEKEGKVKHLIRMKAPNYTKGPVEQEVVIMNSSDSSSSLRLNYGAIRMACLNQLVFGDLLVPELRIKHTRKNPYELIDKFAEDIRASIQDEVNLRAKMEAQKLSFYDIFKLAEFAVTLREDTLENIVDPFDLQTINRKEDTGKDLWTVFNRIQENLIKGNYRKYYEVVDEDTKDLHSLIKKTKVLTNKSKLITVNKTLHQHCAELVI